MTRVFKVFVTCGVVNSVHYSVQCTVCRVPVYPAEDAWVGGVGGAQCTVYSVQCVEYLYIQQKTRG
jgi:hypothetical protein